MSLNGVIPVKKGVKFCLKTSEKSKGSGMLS